LENNHDLQLIASILEQTLALTPEAPQTEFLSKFSANLKQVEIGKEFDLDEVKE